MLELTALSKTYDGFEFGPVDLTVGEEVLSVLGPSGSGKTTLLSLITGTTEPDSGSITLDGRPLDRRSLQERRAGLVFQDGALFPHMTARENISYAATDPDRVTELASLLEITDILDRRPPTLSGGEQQRVALARTLAADPDTLLLDEPLSSLDAPIRRRLRGELHTLFESLTIPIIYVTHDQRTATALGDRMAIFRDGTIAQRGPPSRVLTRPETRFVAQFTGTENLFEGTIVTASEEDTTVRIGDRTVRASATDSAGSTVTVCIHPSRVSLSLEDSETRPESENILPGTVDQWLNEGADYRVDVDIDGAPITIIATIQPAVFDRLAIDTGSPIHVSVPPSAIHLISRQ
ncbi:ABC transporter ATP-binding protein [Halalkalicoccus jeotgali]|uniref:Molybdate/tungstate import ATP-binding protein WtpC n=1 Tax=Halalkalicoccus jeotgali (strain DSM 18796 / CECT 7217 / JCM 14584 / KCTC 4019 / B3) TaxID=795797 RepID=D8JBA0_HALJB|nr:ABC transporter ATP-binding protein [Halalkalicoccus jeotgali]ADJ16553.1 ABC transporter ATP-binding protein [Halalkalicoccus jeotgali B3]ELY41351.1 ABC transporter ATP-binding protein [Halalkalicoccus jeotgali B3]